MEAFDCGPPPAWAALFGTAPLADYVQHPSRRFRAAYGPVYFRGRLDGTARVLIVGQDPSSDETLAQRILVGNAGQFVQGLLTRIGLSQSYVMFNTFLFGMTGQFDSTMRTLSHANPFVSYRNTLLDQAKARNMLQAVVAFGEAAHDAVAHWPGSASLPVFRLLHPTARSGVGASWNAALASLSAAVPPDSGMTPDLRSYPDQLTSADLVDIPRLDLPFGLPAWHGTGGTRSSRKGSTKIVWTAPV